MISRRSCGIGTSSRRTLQVSYLYCSNVEGVNILSYIVLFVYMLSPHFNIPQERKALRNNFIGSVFLHSLRHAYLEQGQDVLENLLDAQAQIYSRRAQILVVAVDAAGVVELVEEGRKVYAVARDARGIVVLRVCTGLLFYSAVPLCSAESFYHGHAVRKHRAFRSRTAVSGYPESRYP